MKIYLSLLLVFVTLSATAVQVRAQDDDSELTPTGYALRYKFKVGDVYSYNLTKDATITIDSGATPAAPTTQTIHIEAVNTWTVTGIRKSDGAAELQNSVTIQNETFNGNDETAPAKAVMVSRPPTSIYMNLIGQSQPADPASNASAETAINHIGLESSDFYINRFGMSQTNVDDGGTWAGTAVVSGLSFPTRSTLSATGAKAGSVVRLSTDGSGSTGSSGGETSGQKRTVKVTAVVLFNTDSGQMESSTYTSDNTVVTPAPASTGGTPKTVHIVTKIQLTRVAAG